VVGALDMYIEKGEWQKALDTAEQQNPKVLHKYVALYATHLIKSGETLRAMDQYVKYGATANPQVRKLTLINKSVLPSRQTANMVPKLSKLDVPCD